MAVKVLALQIFLLEWIKQSVISIYLFFIRQTQKSPYLTQIYPTLRPRLPNRLVYCSPVIPDFSCMYFSVERINLLSTYTFYYSNKYTSTAGRSYVLPTIYILYLYFYYHFLCQVLHFTNTKQFYWSFQLLTIEMEGRIFTAAILFYDFSILCFLI